MKPCVKCGLVFQLDGFRKDASKRDGREPYCRGCRSSMERNRKRKDESVDIDLSDWRAEVLADYKKHLVKGRAPPARANNGRLRRVLAIPDCHVPFESKTAFNLMLKAAASWKPDVVVILGDFVDFYSVSSHSKDPRRVRMLDEEIRAGNERLTQVDRLGATEKYYISGNHEDRLERYLADKAPELFNMVKVRDLLKLDDRGWRYIPYKEHLVLGKFFLTHDVGNAGAQAHVKALKAFQGNAIIGHTHRASIHYEGNAHGDSHAGIHFGWLGDPDAIDYLHKIQHATAWQHAFGVGHMEPNGTIHWQVVPIIKTKDGSRCVVDGVLYVSADT